MSLYHLLFAAPSRGAASESPAGLSRCIGRTRRSLHTVFYRFGPLLRDVFPPSPSPLSTIQGLSLQGKTALLLPVIALSEGSIAGKRGFVNDYFMQRLLSLLCCSFLAYVLYAISA